MLLFVRDADGTWLMPIPGMFVIPLFLAWLLGLVWFVERRRLPALAAGMLALGVAFFTHPSSPLLVVAMAATTLYTLWTTGERHRRPYAVALASLAVPLLPLIPWFVLHPESYPDTLGAWLIHKAHVRFPLDGLRANLGWTTIGTRLSIYWEMFNPVYLFSVIPWPLGVFIPFGAFAAWRRLGAGARTAVFSALIMAPVPAAAFNAQYSTERAWPFIALLALLGVWGAISAVYASWGGLRR